MEELRLDPEDYQVLRDHNVVVGYEKGYHVVKKEGQIIHFSQMYENIRAFIEGYCWGFKNNYKNHLFL